MKRLTDSARFFLKVARPGFWSTSAWFYLLPVARLQVFDTWSFWLGLLYITFPMGFMIYGWNDIVDYDVDRLNPRKNTFLFGARPTLHQVRTLPRSILLVQIPFLVLFVFLEGGRILAWFALMALASAVYNHKCWGWKNRPVLDMANQAGYLLVFILSSWLNQVPQLPWPTFLFGALFAMHSHLLGQIMDVEPDRLAGRRTTAVVVGVRAAKLILAGFLIVEAGLIRAYFADIWIFVFLAAGGAWFTLDGLLLTRDRLYTTREMRLYLLVWNGIALLSMPWMWSRGSLCAVK